MMFAGSPSPSSTTPVRSCQFFFASLWKIIREYIKGKQKKFLTTHHERDLETGLDYRGARFYDSDIARFLSLDPLAADYPSLSDYSYVAGNPIMFIDPTGKELETIYENKETKETVEVKDGVRKTIKVNDTDFQKAKEFAAIEKTHDSQFDLDPTDEWTQTTQQEYYEFYHSVNSYDGVSFANLWDYFRGGPHSGTYEISPGGLAGKAGGSAVASSGIGKYTLSQLKKALKAAYEKLGVKSLPKFKKGKFGSPQRGNSKKGVRLDKEGHPNSTNPNEDGPHINWWDWTKGKKGKGGRHDAVKIEE